MKYPELEEAIQNLIYLIDYGLGHSISENNQKQLKIVLQALKNSIPKEVILDKIRERQFELQQEYIDFKDDIKLNTLQDLLEVNK